MGCTLVHNGWEGSFNCWRLTRGQYWLRGDGKGVIPGVWFGRDRYSTGDKPAAETRSGRDGQKDAVKALLLAYAYYIDCEIQDS